MRVGNPCWLTRIIRSCKSGRGWILDAGCVAVAFSLTVDFVPCCTAGVMLESGAQAWKLRHEVFVCTAAMRWGVVFESCAVADRFPRVEVQDTKEKAVLGNQEHSELEVRGG